MFVFPASLWPARGLGPSPGSQRLPVDLSPRGRLEAGASPRSSHLHPHKMEVTPFTLVLRFMGAGPGTHSKHTAACSTPRARALGSCGCRETMLGQVGSSSQGIASKSLSQIGVNSHAFPFKVNVTWQFGG